LEPVLLAAPLRRMDPMYGCQIGARRPIQHVEQDRQHVPRQMVVAALLTPEPCLEPPMPFRFNGPLKSVERRICGGVDCPGRRLCERWRSWGCCRGRTTRRTAAASAVQMPAAAAASEHCLPDRQMRWCLVPVHPGLHGGPVPGRPAARAPAHGDLSVLLLHQAAAHATGLLPLVLILRLSQLA
jgi:hypothetical protein